MKNLITLSVILTLFIACNDTLTSNNDISNEDDNINYSIITNLSELFQGESYALGIVNLDGVVTKIGAGFSCQEFSYTKDGSLIVYNAISRHYPLPVIVVSDVDKLTDTILDLGDYATYPRISPDGKYVAYMQIGPDSAAGLYIINLNGTNNYKLLGGDLMWQIENWDWSSDSKGINYKIYDIPAGYTTYYLDKNGKNNPIEIDPIWIDYDPFFDKIYYSMTGFDRADLPEAIKRDSVGFIPYQMDPDREKAYTIMIHAGGSILTTPPDYFNIKYLLGYDFKAKTERILIDTTDTQGIILPAWSPNYEILAVITTKGLYITKVDGSSRKIVDFEVASASPAGIYTKLRWIARRN